MVTKLIEIKVFSETFTFIYGRISLDRCNNIFSCNCVLSIVIVMAIFNVYIFTIKFTYTEQHSPLWMDMSNAFANIS